MALSGKSYVGRASSHISTTGRNKKQKSVVVYHQELVLPSRGAAAFLGMSIVHSLSFSLENMRSAGNLVLILRNLESEWNYSTLTDTHFGEEWMIGAVLSSLEGDLIHPSKSPGHHIHFEKEFNLNLAMATIFPTHTTFWLYGSCKLTCI